MNMKLSEFYRLIKDICPTYHYESDLEEFPRQVYTEYATTYEYGSNQTYDEVISINLNHYSKDEFDKTEKLLELTLMSVEEITFNKETNFDEKNKVIINSYDIDISNSIYLEDIFKEIEALKGESQNA